MAGRAGECAGLAWLQRWLRRDLMLKDMGLAVEAAMSVGASIRWAKWRATCTR